MGDAVAYTMAKIVAFVGTDSVTPQRNKRAKIHGTVKRFLLRAQRRPLSTDDTLVATRDPRAQSSGGTEAPSHGHQPEFRS